MSKALEINSLVKLYPGFQLGPIDLELEPGAVLGDVGPNASGKTTTMHCVTGLTRPESRGVRIFGKDNQLSDPGWKSDFGNVEDSASQSFVSVSSAFFFFDQNDLIAMKEWDLTG